MRYSCKATTTVSPLRPVRISHVLDAIGELQKESRMKMMKKTRIKVKGEVHESGIRCLQALSDKRTEDLRAAKL
jgi:hypothetical protein